MFEKVEEKSFYGPWRQDGWVLGVPPSIIVRNRAPFGAGLARKVGPGWSLGAARGLQGGFRVQKECLKKFRKSCFLAPGAKISGF